MQVQRLPTELVDNIVSFLADEDSDLTACSLVCKSWLMPARRHLFRTILFTSTSDAYLDRLREFHALLDNNPYLCGYVQSFEFTYSFRRPERRQFHLDIGVAFDLLSRFTALDTLFVTSMCFKPAARDTTPPRCHARSLELRSVARHTEDTDHISPLFQGLPKLTSLSLITCRIGHDTPGRVANNYGVISLPPDLRLEALRIEDSVTPPFLYALINTATVESLRSLAVLIPFLRRSEHDLDYLKAFLENIGSRLRSFEFRYDTSDEEYYSQSEDELEDDCNRLITPCTDLEELTLHTRFGLPRMPTISWTYTSRILSDITSPKLKHLTFIVSSRNDDPMSSGSDVGIWQRDVPWNAIREGLSKLRSLETLTFVSERVEGLNKEWKPHELDQEVQAHVREKVAGCLQDMTELSFEDPEK